MSTGIEADNGHTHPIQFVPFCLVQCGQKGKNLKVEFKPGDSSVNFIVEKRPIPCTFYVTSFLLGKNNWKERKQKREKEE